MILSVLFVSCIAAVCGSQYQSWPPVVPQQRQLPSSHRLAGNVGLYGSGSGDVYIGRLGEGLYGAGTRFGGQVGIAGTAGYAGGQGLRGKRAIVKSRITGSAVGETARTDDMFLATGSVVGAAKLGFGDESTEESAETTTQTSTTTLMTTSKQEEGKTTTERSRKPVCTPKRLRAGRK